MRRKRLLWQLYPSYLSLIILSLLIITWYATSASKRFFYAQAASVLESRARVAQWSMSGISGASGELARLCEEMDQRSDTRITIILPSGVVIADSRSDASTMENHADRPEIIEAIAGRVGNSIRRSPTLDTPMMYAAIPGKDPLGNPIVIRTAMTISHIDETLRGLQIRIAIAGLGIAALAAIVCLFVSRRIAGPLEEMQRGVEQMKAGDLARRLHVPRVEEMGSLAAAINNMAEQLQDQINQLMAQRNEQEAVFASMVEAVFAVDTQEKVLRMNQAAGRLLDVPPSDAHGKNIQEITRNTVLQRFIAQTLAASAPTEAEILLEDDGERWIQVHGTTLNDAAGRRIGAVVVANDVTRIRRLEGFRRDFVANVSHELRTPITSIKGFVETLLDGAVKDPESAERFLGIVARQADRLNAIINDLLLLSQLEQQGEKAAMTVEEASIRDMLKEAIELCASKAAAKKISISVSCNENLKARVNVPLLEQAIVNLVDNAAKYSDPGKTVFIEAWSDGGALKIQVRDEGWGIEKEHLSRVFERFYRVDKGRSRELGGTGLGLAIVKHITQAHGGAVAVDSTAGKGSVFTLTIPAR